MNSGDVCFDAPSNNAFSLVSGQMSNPGPDTLNTLLRQPSSSDQEPAATSASQPSSQNNILEEIEVEEAKKGKQAASSRRKVSGTEDENMASLREYMRHHSALLERLLVPPNSEREVFVRWVSDTLRTCSPAYYLQLQSSILNTAAYYASEGGVAAGVPSTGDSSSEFPQPQRTPQRPPPTPRRQQQQQQQQQQQLCLQQQQQPGTSGYQPPSFPSPNMFASPPFPWGMDGPMSPRPRRPRESSENVGRVLATNY